MKRQALCCKLPGFKNETIIPMFLLNEKWLLLKVDIILKSVTVINPYETTSVECKEGLDNFLHFLKKYNCANISFKNFKLIDEDSWTCRSINHPTVSNPFESGISLSHYIDSVLLKVELCALDLQNYCNFLKAILK